MGHDGRMYRLAAAGIGVLTGLTAVLLLAAPASAHAKLLSSTPKEAGTVTEAITKVELRFSEPVRQSRTTVRVTGPDGASHRSGGPAVVVDTVTQNVSALPAGAITVTWVTVSVDGHSIKGDFAFTNRAAAPAGSAPPPTPSAPAAAPTPSTIGTTPVSEESNVGLAGVLISAVFVPVAGLLAGLWWWRRRGAGAGR